MELARSLPILAAIALALVLETANGSSELPVVVVQDGRSPGGDMVSGYIGLPAESHEPASFQRALLSELSYQQDEIEKPQLHRKISGRRFQRGPTSAPPTPTSAPPPAYEPSSEPESPPPAPRTTASLSASDTQQAYLDPHNAARALKSLEPLAWDTTLEEYALNWGNHQKNTGNCALVHSHGPYGENLFWGWGKAWTPAEAVQAWVDEEKYYDYASNTCVAGQMCGHYTQVVWASTTRLGCASVTCNDGSIFFTCSYDPPGNWVGQKPY